MKKYFSFLLLFLSFQTFTQSPKGDRTIAWLVDMTENNNYDSAFHYALNGCMESSFTAINWSTIEPINGNFNSSLIAGYLDVMNIYYPAYGIPVALQIAPINTTTKETPADLLSISFDSPLMINRFKVFLDTLFSHLPNLELSQLNIGNESDIFMGTNALDYGAYKTFLDSVIPYAKQLYQNLHGTDLKVGTTLTFSGLNSPSTDVLCQNLNANLDIVSVTYYPLNANFTMKNPSVVPQDFASLVAHYPDTSQPIYFAECGYSSSATCNSSEQLQSEFFTTVFQTWDLYSDNIKYLTIFKSTDWSQQAVDQLGLYYGISDPVFLEYLRTLGVRTYAGNGMNKPAYETILCELALRDWCNVTCAVNGIEENKTEVTFHIYPNPFNEMLQIDLNSGVTSIELINPMGEVILKTTEIIMEVSSLTHGFYTARITMADGRIYREKLLKL